LIDPKDDNILWIGTKGQGMSRLNIAQNTFTNYNTKNGLSDDVIYGILSDDESPRNLWISMNRGLNRFCDQTGIFNYYYKSDGIQDDEFNTYASFKSRTGELHFGGVNGLTIFDPKDFNVNIKPPNVRFSGLEINGKPINPRDKTGILDQDITYMETIELPFSQNNIRLNFSANDYTSPTRNQFAYYLEGAEKQWIHKGFDHTAQYLNLPPGSYTFWVKAANSNGVWNEKPISIKIIIHAPWYRTWFAYLFYVAVLFSIIYYLYHTQLRQKLDQQETNRLKELDSFKSKLYTNLTHEFRTPLTVILGMNSQIKKNPKQFLEQGTQLIESNGKNLLRLINQLLDLSKLENKSFKINLVQDDILPYLRYLVESFQTYANSNNLSLRFFSTLETLSMDFDIEQIKQILTNLISNAVKFTPSGGHIDFKVNMEGEFLKLTIKDSGIGIEEKDLPHIFDRFFQVNGSHTRIGEGTGIGLAHTLELVKIMGGTISATSEIGKGTEFKLLLPITRNSKLAAKVDMENQLKTLDKFDLDYDQNTSERSAFSDLRKDAPDQAPLLLIIEDNPDVVIYLKSCLQGLYHVEVAYNGKIGIEKALELVPDIIISDVMMPEKDGYEVCNVLKADERTSHIPIILLTAKADHVSKIAGLRRGADAYLTKPFDTEELLVRLQLLVSRQKSMQSYFTNKDATDVSKQNNASLENEDIQIEDAFLI
jgi:signal transduction histidine kinase/CheY-like chemotaxis protein